MGAGLLSLVGAIGKHPCEKNWERITPLEYLIVDKPRYVNKYSKENISKDLYKSENSIKLLKKSPSLLLGEASILSPQNRINSLLPAISNLSFHSDDRSLMITGTKISKGSIAKLDSYLTVLSAAIKIQHFARRHCKPKPTSSKQSLRCLKLLEALAFVFKSRKGKYIKLLRRCMRKAKRI
jgi:hypothetical protein